MCIEVVNAFVQNRHIFIKLSRKISFWTPKPSTEEPLHLGQQKSFPSQTEFRGAGQRPNWIQAECLQNNHPRS